MLQESEGGHVGRTGGNLTGKVQEKELGMGRQREMKQNYAGSK